MSTVSTSFPPPAAAAAHERSDLGVPPWVADLLARSEARPADDDAACPELRVLESPAFTLLSVRKSGAAALDPQGFEACTRDAYSAIASRLRRSIARHPVRFWNYI